MATKWFGVHGQCFDFPVVWLDDRKGILPIKVAVTYSKGLEN